MIQSSETFSSANRINPGLNPNFQTEMIQNMNYEFRTPLAILLGYTDLLYDEAFGQLTGYPPVGFCFT